MNPAYEESKDPEDCPAPRGYRGQPASQSMGNQAPRAAQGCQGFGASLAQKGSLVPAESEG